MSHLDELDIPEGTVIAVDDKTSKRSDIHKGYEYDAFNIPVGNVIACAEGHRSEPWWVPPERIEYIRTLCEPFTKYGAFKLHVGDLKLSSANPMDFMRGYKPQVIMSITQERGTNKPFCPNTKGVPALLNDVMVWLTLEDKIKAANILKDRADIPVALVADAVDYDIDMEYRLLYDKANAYFMHYYLTGEPVKLSMSKDDVERGMYDV